MYIKNETAIKHTSKEEVQAGNTPTVKCDSIEGPAVQFVMCMGRI